MIYYFMVQNSAISISLELLSFIYQLPLDMILFLVRQSQSQSSQEILQGKWKACEISLVFKKTQQHRDGTWMWDKHGNGKSRTFFLKQNT